jgi:phage terminase large subunit-like protein
MGESLFAQLASALSSNWRSRARPEQLPPAGDWQAWLVLAGRGFGKTWIATNVANEWASTSAAKRIGLIAPTAADCRDVLVEGPSGIMATAPSWCAPDYEPSKRRITWPNGATALLFSAEEPERLRGPNLDALFCDEMAAWQNAEQTWNMAQMCLRIGRRPRTVITTTPRPLKLLKNLIARDGQGVVVTRGSTYDNAANLAPTFLEEIRARYEGTRLGRQELNAELLEDVPGALWTREMVERARYDGAIPDLVRVVVAIDPSGTSGNDNGDSVGIVVCGIGRDGLGFVLSDLTVKASPAVWGRIAVDAYHQHKADRIIAERNFGGAMVEHVIRSVDPLVPYRDVTASRGKVARAEPVSAFYEQNRVRHCANLSALEDQLCAMTGNGYQGDGSPDRADALVWALTELMGQPVRPAATFGTYSRFAEPIPGLTGSYARQDAPKSRFDGEVTITDAQGNVSTGFATSKRY